MSTLIITLVFGFLSRRFVYPPLAVLVFIFFDTITTPGTAGLIPFSEYIDRIVWGGLVGAAFSSIIQLYRDRQDSPGKWFSWRIGMVCLLIFVLIRISVIIGTGDFTFENDLASVGPLTLIIVLAYFHDHRAWWCFALIVIVQLCLSLFVISNPSSTMNGYYAYAGDPSEAKRLLSHEVEENGMVGSRTQGQFGNTVSLAMYAVVAVAAGISLLEASIRSVINKNYSGFAGIILVAIGVLLLAVSTTRGAIIGLVLGIMIHYFGIRGYMRLFLFTAIILSLFAIVPNFADIIPADDPVLSRFVLLNDLNGTEYYRLTAIQTSYDAVMTSPLLGWGTFEIGLKACKGYMAHQGPYSLAVLYGIPVGFLSCIILILSINSDLTGNNIKFVNYNPNFRPLCAFSTISSWSTIVCIMTNGFGTPTLQYIILGIAMWPNIYQGTISSKSSGDCLC